ncbi:hypothetical protein GH714_007110 [Hevea brasiliensis]|uniref:Uncharacterized protein n=1 Tax=Hevea brasiliensis TaxID=3981 RepID=A0A6A6KC35_HEVBR|nr:hypothetical protein GH714_007110 [Hevea brasiliensis]
MELPSLLKQALFSVPADSLYDYQHTWGPVLDSGRPILRAGFDLAQDLLSDDDFWEVVHQRHHDLYNLAVELEAPPDRNPNGAHLAAGMGEMTSSSLVHGAARAVASGAAGAAAMGRMEGIRNRSRNAESSRDIQEVTNSSGVERYLGFIILLKVAFALVLS